MNKRFAETLKKLRTDKGLSQRELAERMYVNRSTVARWESGSRLPDAVMISRLSRCLGIDVNTLLSAAAESDDAPNVIMVDDRKLFLSGALPILEEVMPGATISCFIRPSEAVEYATANRIALAFLDIEMGNTNGLDLCRTLLSLNPRTNVVYLTAHAEYAFDAWSTGASGFLLKPITTEAVQAQLKNLRYPFSADAKMTHPAPAVGANVASRSCADTGPSVDVAALGHPWPSADAKMAHPGPAVGANVASRSCADTGPSVDVAALGHPWPSEGRETDE